jgi:hypothetical protein
MTTRLSITALALALTLSAAPVAAQLLPGGGVGGVLRGATGTVGDLARPALGGLAGEDAGNSSRERSGLIGGTFDRVSHLASSVAGSTGSLLDLRELRHALLVKAHRGELARDGQGNVVRRDRLMAVEPDAPSLAAAARAGFAILGQADEPELGLRVVTLAVPRGMSPRDALDRLRRAAPAIEADYDHIFEPAGGALSPATTALAVGAAALVPPGARIAMIDGGVASHPSMARATIEQKGFAGAASATGHGTAVASLLVGDQGVFKGAARGASLFVADIYGGNPAAGSASAIVRALGWAAGKHPQVINMSLVGPANRVIERAVAVLRTRGIAVVAAVGNDGPAAPPQYPASYDGVIAVTGVDGRNEALVEAGRARHLDFAAPGADLAAALPGSGYASVRGTSFAAPLVAARFAAAGSIDRLAAETRPGKGKVGRGIVCSLCRTAPKSVGAK